MQNKQREFLDKIERHRGIIYKVSKVYFDHPDDQEDLRQEIIYQLWISFESFRAESQFSTWMYRIAINTAILYFKKEKKRDEIQQSFYLDTKNLQDQESQVEDKLKVIYRSFQHLDKIEKAIMYYFLEGMSHSEIATNLGISEANARVKLHRAKEKIKSIISKDKENEF